MTARWFWVRVSTAGVAAGRGGRTPWSPARPRTRSSRHPDSARSGRAAHGAHRDVEPARRVAVEQGPRIHRFKTLRDVDARVERTTDLGLLGRANPQAELGRDECRPEVAGFDHGGDGATERFVHRVSRPHFAENLMADRAFRKGQTIVPREPSLPRSSGPASTPAGAQRRPYAGAAPGGGSGGSGVAVSRIWLRTIAT